MTQPTLLLTGASGFIGRHAAVALGAAGFHLRGLSRSVQRARRLLPEIEWLEGDLESPDHLERALERVDTAVYLYHAIGSSHDYTTREAHVARAFQQAASRARVGRIVYLGGVVPTGASSPHLESRRITGEILRCGPPTAIELRASLIIGHPSASFGLIRDLTVRMPWLVLPPWLDNESCPISICDVAVAIALACRIPCRTSAWFELPGPECLSHRQLLEYLAGPLGTRIAERRISALTPGIAALGIAAISRVDSSLSRELVRGLGGDLRPTGPSFWDQLGNPELRPLRQAIVDALSDATSSDSPAPETRRRIARKTLDWLERYGCIESE